MINNDLGKVTINILKNSKKEFLLKLLFSILVRVSLLILPILLSSIVDSVTANDFKLASIFIVLSIFLTIFERVSEYFNQVTYYNLYNKLYKDYSLKNLNTTIHNSTFSLSRFQLAEYSNIMNNDIDVISSFFSNAVLRIVQIFEFLFIYVYFFQLNFYIFLITLVLSIIVFIIVISSGKKIQLKNRKQKEELDKKTIFLHEIFLGIKEIKGFHVYSKIKEKLNLTNDNYLKASKNYNLAFNTNQIISLVTIEIFRLVLLIFVAWLIVNGQAEVGVLLIIYNYYQKIIDNFTMITTVNVEFRTLKVALGRINKLFEYRKEEIKKPNIPLTQFTGNITFQNVLYGYRHDPILNHASFDIQNNTLTIITGKGSSGKNGIVDLLMRYNEQHEGFVRIDDYNIKDINDNTYSNLISCVKNQPLFFTGSIKENLMMIDPDFERIQEVCTFLGIHDTIMSLKDGYDSIISETSTSLSSTNRLLLATARVFLTRSKIMLFDEVIELLDNKTQTLILTILKKLKKNHTIIIITRNKALLKHADEIIIVDSGQVAKEGTYKELIKDKKSIELLERI